MNVPDSVLPTGAFCSTSGGISFDGSKMQFTSNGGTGFNFDNPIIVSNIVTTTGFQAGLNAGLSVTVAVRNSAGAGTCNLVFTGGILTSETYP